MDAEEKARIEAEMAEKLEALSLMEKEKREKDEELEQIRLQVHTNVFAGTIIPLIAVVSANKKFQGFTW